jgi:hypothetical protein
MKIRICMSCGEVTEFINDKTLNRDYVKGGLCRECAELDEYLSAFFKDEAKLFQKYGLPEVINESEKI